MLDQPAGERPATGVTRVREWRAGVPGEAASPDIDLSKSVVDLLEETLEIGYHRFLLKSSSGSSLPLRTKC